MSKVMKKFARKVASPLHAGRGREGSPPSSESDITVDASPPAPGTGIGQKRRAESPTESLAPSDTEVRQTGAEKSVKKQHACTASGAALCVGPVNAGGDGQSITVEMRDMLENFRHELRTELKTIVTDSIAETIGQRLDSLEVVVNEQRQDINRLSAENRRLKAAIEKCAEDVVISENGAKSAIAEVKQTVATFTARHPVANLTSPNPAGNAIQGTSEATLHDLVAEATDRSSRVNNIVLRGLLESPSEDLPAIISTLAPQVAPGDILSATRIGQLHSNTTGAVTTSARLVRAVLAPTTKAQLMRHKTQAKHKGENVYIQHDLTRQEQARRKELVPKVRALRSKGVKCHLPRDAITLNGKHLTSQDIARLLTTQSQ